MLLSPGASVRGDDPSIGVRLAALGALVRLGHDAVGNELLALGTGKDL